MGIFHQLLLVPRISWMFIGLTAAFASISLWLRLSNSLPSPLIFYGFQPLWAMTLAGVAFLYSRHNPHESPRHAKDKAILVGSTLSLCFVAYFATGIITTYTRNALAGGPGVMLQNITAFGITAASLEYVRYTIFTTARRRNVQILFPIVSIIFAIAQLYAVPLVLLDSLEKGVIFIISEIAPLLMSSFLASYLVITGGLSSVLTYRLGLVAMTILPPLIPKFDWYLKSITSIIITITVYMTISQTIRTRQSHSTHTLRRLRQTGNTMWLICLVGLAAFMSGFFSYKPFAIMSNSMVPIYSRGSIVIVDTSVKPVDIVIGDIVQFEGEDRLITHRVIAIDAQDSSSSHRIFTTQGDSNPSPDPRISEEKIRGVIKATLPLIGYPSVWLRELSIK